MRVRAKEIAKMLGISPAAVSLVINNKPGVSDETRKKVLNKLKEYGQEVTGVLESNVAFVVYKKHGVILNEDPIFSLLLENLSQALRIRHYLLKIYYIDQTNQIEQEIQRIIEDGCEGILLWGTEMENADFTPFSEAEIPFVSIDNRAPYLPINAVSINNDYGSFLAIKYLKEQGHEKIGYVASKTVIQSFTERFNGYKKAMKLFNLPIKKEHLLKVAYSSENSYASTVEILKKTSDLATAYLVDNDILANGFLRALKEFKIKVPEDVAIIGFDNRPIATMSSPTLTSIDISTDTIAKQSVDVLLSALSQIKDDFVKAEVGTSLIIRESTSKE